MAVTAARAQDTSNEGEAVASVLVVDGTASDHGLLVTVLRQAGYLVLEAATGKQPLGRAGAEDDPDLAIAYVRGLADDGYDEETHREQFRVLNTKLLQEVDDLREAVIRAGALHERLARDGQNAPGAVGSAVPPGSRAEDVLSPRELHVLAMIAEGAANSEIARRLLIAETTVQSHVRHILNKLGVRNRTEAAVRYLRGDR